MGTTSTKPRGGREATGDTVDHWLDTIGQHPLLTAEEERRLAQLIEAGEEAARRLEAGEDTLELRRAVRAGKEAKEKFIACNLRLVVSVARRYMGHGVDLADLIAEGNLGLIRAVEKFDWRKGFKFSTYATHWISQAVSRGIANYGRTIRYPAHIHDQLNTLNRSRATLEARLGREATPQELAEHSGLERKDVEKLLSLQEATSYDQPVGDDGDATLADWIADDNQPSEDEIVERVDGWNLMGRYWHRLTAREQKILVRRFGLETGAPQTLDDVAAAEGVTRERIRQIEIRALRKMQRWAKLEDEQGSPGRR